MSTYPTINPVGTTLLQLDDGEREDPERVSLAPLDPVTALKGLLATPPPADDRSPQR